MNTDIKGLLSMTNITYINTVVNESLEYNGTEEFDENTCFYHIPDCSTLERESSYLEIIQNPILNNNTYCYIISNCVFNDLHSIDIYGSSLFIDFYLSTIIVTDVTFSHCIHDKTGAAIYAKHCLNLSVSKTCFLSIDAPEGASIYALPEEYLSISDIIITGRKIDTTNDISTYSTSNVYLRQMNFSYESMGDLCLSSSCFHFVHDYLIFSHIKSNNGLISYIGQIHQSPIKNTIFDNISLVSYQTQNVYIMELLSTNISMENVYLKNISIAQSIIYFITQNFNAIDCYSDLITTKMDSAIFKPLQKIPSLSFNRDLVCYSFPPEEKSYKTIIIITVCASIVIIILAALLILLIRYRKKMKVLEYNTELSKQIMNDFG